MSNEPTSAGGEEQGATVVITHRVREDGHEGYERWLKRVTPVCMSYPGHIDWQIIRPVAGLTATYTVVIRFDRREHLEAWINSEDRRRLIEEVQPFLAKNDDFHIRSGLDFWFTPEGAKAQTPVRWKQFLVTWSAIYPLVLGVSPGVVRGMRSLGVEAGPLLTHLVATGLTVWLMTYVVMPRYTKLLKRWLFA
jgi:antibiotic biosynthesis monooxygenase (ABM) superfamily enzyme